MPNFQLLRPREYETLSMNCTRLIVVSRGLKLLRPMLRFPPPVLITASGSALFAWPGSLSRAH